MYATLLWTYGRHNVSRYGVILLPDATSYDKQGVTLFKGFIWEGILRRKSLVSTDTVCNTFVRQS